MSDNIQDFVQKEIQTIFPEKEFGIEDTIAEMLKTMSFYEVVDLVISLAHKANK